MEYKLPSVHKFVVMGRDLSWIVMMVTLEIEMDVTNSVLLRKDGLVKVDPQLNPVLVSPSPHKDQLFPQQAQLIFSVVLFKASE